MSYYPPSSFYFAVTFDGASTGPDAGFAEVDGLEAERPAFEIREGGENRYAHRVPERARFGNLVLRRGVMVWQSPLASWCKTILESDLTEAIVPKDLNVDLLDSQGESLVKWSFTRAWPVKWNVSQFASDRNDLAVETFELAYASFTRVPQTAGRRRRS